MHYRIPEEIFQHEVEQALQVLREGGTILYPTDTVWGIGCDATNEEAVEKIFSIKERPANRSCIILLADERDLIQYVAALDLSVFNYLDSLDSPTTIIFDDAVGIAENAVAEDGSVAIRIVKEPFCKNLIKRLRKPLISTSANISGAPTPASFADISPEIKQRVDHIVRLRQDENSSAKPSSIVRWNDGNPELIRS
ncbi:MAG TPA: L-threonylcarbamoyladenylate synthase [Parasegetibacter sp.]